MHAINPLKNKQIGNAMFRLLKEEYIRVRGLDSEPDLPLSEVSDADVAKMTALFGPRFGELWERVLAFRAIASTTV